MTTYLIIPRKPNDPGMHASESLEEAACQIAKELMRFRGTYEDLMAFRSDSPSAGLAAVQDTILCTVDLDPESHQIWINDYCDIKSSLEEFESIRSRAQFNLENTLTEMSSRFAESEAFNAICPEDEINIDSAMSELDESGVSYRLNNAVRKLYQFKEIEGSLV